MCSAVLGPPPDRSNAGGPNVFDSIVGKATNSTPPDDNSPSPGDSSAGHRITLYRNGFTVDNGPLRGSLRFSGRSRNRNSFEGLINGFLVQY